MKKTICRVCQGRNLHTVLNLGRTPLANAFLKEVEVGDPEPYYPLELLFCDDCSFVQLSEVVPPDILFRDYLYTSSTSPVFIKHFEELAGEVCSRFDLKEGDVVVDIGSNDGILLKPFKKLGMKVFGFDPAFSIAMEATEEGILTIPCFFDREYAISAAKQFGKAKVVTATSVFPHIDDLDSFVAGVKELLTDDGVFMIECYYLRDLIEKNLFDTVYHEHLSYFTAHTLMRLFDRLDMQIFDIQKTDTHGGSLRVFVQKNGGPHKTETRMTDFLIDEANAGFDHEELLVRINEFDGTISKNKFLMMRLLDKLEMEEAKVFGYGAPAKSTTLLNVFGFGPNQIRAIADDSQLKQGLYTPGTHIRIIPFSKMLESDPDYVILFAWNFAESLMSKLRNAGYGGKFIIPVPEPKIIE